MTMTPEQVKLLTTFHQEHTPRQGELVTLGYTEPDALPRLDEFMARPDTGLVDIRYSPRERGRPEFNQAALIKRYGALKYGHCKALGNVNYNKPGEPINLYEPYQGATMVTHMVRRGRSIILLCACRDYERCHRKTAYELIKNMLDHRIGEMVIICAGEHKGEQGRVYNHSAGSHNEWHVRPLSWPDDIPGIAFCTDELLFLD